jgi:hypothetical protein
LVYTPKRFSEAKHKIATHNDDGTVVKITREVNSYELNNILIKTDLTIQDSSESQDVSSLTAGDGDALIDGNEAANGDVTITDDTTESCGILNYPEEKETKEDEVLPREKYKKYLFPIALTLFLTGVIATIIWINLTHIEIQNTLIFHWSPIIAGGALAFILVLSRALFFNNPNRIVQNLVINQQLIQ